MSVPAAPLIDLTTLAAVKSYLSTAGATAPSDDDLQTLLTEISQQMQTFADRRLVSQPYVVSINGVNQRAVSLPNTPITAVAALAIDGCPVPASVAAPTPGFAFSDTQIGLRGPWRFEKGFQNIAISYTGGFAPIPADLVRACNEAVLAGVLAMTSDIGLPPGTISYKAGDTQVVLGSIKNLAALCLTPAVTAILSQYRRVVPC